MKKDTVSLLRALPKEYSRRFVPDDLDCTDKDAVVSFFRALIDRSLDSVDDLRRWMSDSEEFSQVIGEAHALAHIDFTCHVHDEEKKNAIAYFEEELSPALKPLHNEWEKKYIACPHRSELDKDFWHIHDKSIESSLSLFREENISLQTKDSKLSRTYEGLTGKMTVEWDGEEKTLQQMGLLQLEQDRDVREKAWRLVADRRMRDADEIEAIFDDMVRVRHRIAVNAGFVDYRDYIFEAKERWDYTPEDCFEYHAAVEETVVPLVRALQERRRKDLGVDTLRPWDGEVDVFGRAPLKAFEHVDELVAGVHRIYARIDTRFADMFGVLVKNGLLDLGSRKGKAPGGYQIRLSERRLPFIFMNAVGKQRDVETLLHEGGHAFHVLMTRDMEVRYYAGNYGAEMAEVASMSQELLSVPHLDEFYSKEDADRAVRELLEGTLSALAWIARIDAFQHWIYTHPDHSREERAAQWLELGKRFGGITDYSGLEEHQRRFWQRQLHIFTHPFYYIEYGIAQIGALQVWQNSMKDTQKAIGMYLEALSLGGSRPLPELYRAAGIRFDLSRKTLEPLVRMLAQRLDVDV